MTNKLENLNNKIESLERILIFNKHNKTRQEVIDFINENTLQHWGIIPIYTKMMEYDFI